MPTIILKNTDDLREFLKRGNLLQYLDVPSFEFDVITFEKATQEVLRQRPHYTQDRAEARAAYRLLSMNTVSNKAPVIAQGKTRWVRTLKTAWNISRDGSKPPIFTTSRVWHWVKIIWAILLLAGVFTIAFEGRAHAQGNANGTGNAGNALQGINLQFQNAGTPLATRVSGRVNVNCGTNMSCSFVGNTFTLTSTGGAGSGCTPPGSSGSLLYDNAAGGCLDISKFTTNGTTTITGLATSIFDLSAGATFKAPASAGFAPTTANFWGYDTTNNRGVLGNGTDTSILTWIHGTAPTANDCVKFSGTLGALITNGGPCPTTKALVSHQFFTSYTSTTGVFTAAQPDYSDLTGVPATFTATAHNLLSATHGDTTTHSVVRGDLIAGIGASPTWTAVAKGGTNTYPKWNSSGDVIPSTLAASGVGAGASHQFATATNADAAPTFAQPTLADIAAGVAPAGVFDFTGATPTVPTQSSSDNSTKAASTAFVTTAVTNGIAASNPAVAVQAATTAASDTSSFTYSNGVGGIGATFTGTVNTAVTVDGFTFTTLGQRLLVKNDTQSPSGAFNGVYYVTQIQTAILAPILTRALDYDAPSDINNTGAIPVINGTVNIDTSWLLTSTVNTVGTDPLTYVKFSLNPTTLCAPNGTVNRILLDNQPSGCVDLGSLGTTITVLHGNGSGAPTFAAVTSADTTGTFPATAHNLLSATHSDTLAGSVVRGDLITGNATPAWSKLAIGGNGTCLTSNGTDASWGSCAAGSGVTLQTDNVNNSSQTSLNLLDSAATNGLTLTHTNTSAGNVQLGLSGILTVPGGGTGLNTLTAHALYVGNATGLPVAIPLGINGQVLESCGAGCDPTFQDPIVSGPDAPGAAATKNPIQIGGVDNSSNAQRVLIINTATTGMEYGLVVRDADDDVQLQQLFSLSSNTKLLDTPLFSTTGNSAPGPNSFQPESAELTGCEFRAILPNLTNKQVTPCLTDKFGRTLVDIGASVPIPTISMDGSGIKQVYDPCQYNWKIYGSNAFTGNTQIITGVVNKKIFFCAWNDQNASTAQNYVVVEGTGSTCATGIAAFPGLSGGTTAATGWNVGASGGRVIGNGGASFAGEATAGDNVCVLISGSTEVNVGYAYVVIP